jgi:VWFA-related protein
MKRRFIWLLCGVTLAATSAPLAARQNQRPRPTFSSAVDIVSVDVNVIDRSGHPVRDLTARDFTLTVDGRARRIVSAQFVPLTAAPAAVEPAADDYSTNIGGPPGRFIAVVVDRGTIPPVRAKDVFGAAAQFVEDLLPRDRVALFSIPTGPEIDFTTSHDRIVSALLSTDGQASPIPSTKFVGIAEALDMERGNTIAVDEVMERECGRAVFVGRDSTGMSEVQQCERMVQDQAAFVATDAHERARNTLAGLRAILSRLGSSDTPKTIVLISEGLVIDGERLDVNGLGRMLADAHATVYALKPEPSDTDPSQPRAPRDRVRERTVRETGLTVVAKLGGGDMFRVLADPHSVFARVSSELSGYYLLGFEPDATDRDGRQHAIEVGVDRPGVEVRSRAEFSVESSTNINPEHVVAELLQNPAMAADLPFKLTTYAFQDPDSSKIRLLVALTVDPVKAEGPVALGIAVLKPDGSTEKTFFQPSVDVETDATGRVRPCFATMLVDPGRYALKAAIVDQRGHRGSLERQVRAYMTRMSRFRATQLLIGDDEGRKPAPGSIVPTVSGEMGGDHLHAYMELFSDTSAGFAGTSVTVEILPAGGSAPVTRAAAVLQPAGDDPRVRSASGSLPLTFLPQGRYLARAVVAIDGRPVGEMTRPFRIVRAGR